MHPTDQTYLSLKRVFLENLEANRLEDQIANFNNLTTEKDKWKFINESRNARRTKTEITSLTQRRSRASQTLAKTFQKTEN